MIDENKLDELEKESKGPYFQYGAMGIPIQDAKELIRLARLGLWAEKHGISVLKLVANNDEYDLYYEKEAINAIAALKAIGFEEIK